MAGRCEGQGMPRFVVLEHRWNGVHWDFMLEWGSVLRTWALAAPIEPGVDIVARSLGDHRLAYLEYEGPVSGDRGEVRRVDSGTYELLAVTPERVRVRLAGIQVCGLADLKGPPSETGAPGEPAAWSFRLGKVD